MTYNHGLQNQVHDFASYMCYLLDQKGVLYRFGYNPANPSDSKFQCSIVNESLIHQYGSGSRTNYLPREITNISAGHDHMVVIRNGFAYGIGSNKYGQLGVGASTYYPQLKLLSSRNDYVKAACGPYHTMLLTTKGNIYVSGRNDVGQLGLNHTSNRTSWVKISQYDGRYTNIAASSTGDYFDGTGTQKTHCAATLDATKILCTWGDNTYGQLGHGDKVDRKVPTALYWAYKSFSGVITNGSNIITKVPAIYTTLGQDYTGRYINYTFDHNGKTYRPFGFNTLGTDGRRRYTRITKVTLDASDPNFVNFELTEAPGVISGTDTLPTDGSTHSSGKSRSITKGLGDVLRPLHIALGKNKTFFLEGAGSGGAQSYNDSLKVIFCGYDQAYTGEFELGTRCSDIAKSIIDPEIISISTQDYCNISAGLNHVSMIRRNTGSQ